MKPLQEIPTNPQYHWRESNPQGMTQQWRKKCSISFKTSRKNRLHEREPTGSPQQVAGGSLQNKHNHKNPLGDYFETSKDCEMSRDKPCDGCSRNHLSGTRPWQRPGVWGGGSRTPRPPRDPLAVSGHPPGRRRTSRGSNYLLTAHEDSNPKSSLPLARPTRRPIEPLLRHNTPPEWPPPALQ